MREFTGLQVAFVELYSDPTGECWSNALKSARTAGYAEAGLRAAASKLMANQEIRKAINELVKEHVVESLYSPDIVKMNLARVARLSEEKNDLSTAARCHELLGKTWGMFSDRMIQAVEDPERERVLTESEKEECRRIALWRFDTRLSEAGPEQAASEPSPEQKRLMGT